MTQTVVRVVLAGVWMTVGVGLLFRGLLPEEWFAGRDAVTLNLLGMMALVLAVYNVLRLVVYWRRRWARAKLRSNPLTRTRPDAPREYNPELDFTGTGPPPDEAHTEPRPPGNG